MKVRRTRTKHFMKAKRGGKGTKEDIDTTEKEERRRGGGGYLIKKMELNVRKVIRKRRNTDEETIGGGGKGTKEERGHRLSRRGRVEENILTSSLVSSTFPFPHLIPRLIPLLLS